MIPATAKLSIRRIPLDCIQIKEYQQRYPKRLEMYIQLMQARPDDHCGLLSVMSSPTHDGMYVLMDGHHRFCAAIMTGRTELLCIVIEEEEVSHDTTRTRTTLSSTAPTHEKEKAAR